MIQKFKSVLLPAAALLLSSHIAFAIPKPDKCPSVDVIKYRGLLYAQKDCSGTAYVVPQLDRYGTSEAWIFAIENISAADRTEAFTKATALLPTLSGTPQPEEEESGTWMCHYSIGEDKEAFAMTLNDDANLINLSAIKHKK